MICMKTGAEIYLAEYGLWCRGDFFEAGSTGPGVRFGLLRINNATLSPDAKPPIKHITVHQVAQWFDRSADGTSTLITTGPNAYTFFGQIGVSA